MRSSSLSYAALCATLGCALPSFAQTTQSDEQHLGQITLTASGSAVPLSRTGASVSVLTAADLQTDGDASVANQLARLPGVSMSRNGGIGTSTALRIRGLGAPYIGVRIDGLDVADPSGTQCAYDFGSTTSANLSRIEVLRGSQSALFGSEAIAGVVDITTFRAENEGTEAKISLEAGSANTTNAAASVGMKHERVELAFSASRVSTDGISAYAYGREKDAFHATTLTYFGAYEVAQGVKLGFNGIARNSFVEFDSQTGDNGETEDGRLRGNRAFLQAEIGQTTHEFAVARVTTQRDYPLGWIKKYEGERKQLNWSGSWISSDALTLNWGLDHTKEAFAASLDKGDVQTSAAYGEALWAANPNLDLSFALRRDDHETFGGKTSGRFGAAWRPTNDWIIRAVAATGFRAPSLYELYSGYGNPDLKPETSRSYELGAEYILSENGSLQATLFDTEIDNKINFGRRTYEQVPGTTKTRGIELVGRYTLTPDWTIFGNYTYTDAYAENGGVKIVAVRVPRHDLAISLEGTITQTLTAHASVRRVADFSDNGIYPAPASKMPNYTVVNAGLGYQVSDTSNVWLRVENLLDEQYQTVRNYGQAGRQIFVGLGTTF